MPRPRLRALRTAAFLALLSLGLSALAQRFSTQDREVDAAVAEAAAEEAVVEEPQRPTPTDLRVEGIGQ